MIIEYGINPNCSETVFRFKKEYLDKVPKSLLERSEDVPTDEYSQMRPNKNEICAYFYQSDGYNLLKFLEENKIPYDTQQFMNSPGKFPQWELLNMRRNERKLSTYGGSGDFYRRKKYGHGKRN